MKSIDLTSKKFNKLQVLSYSHTDKHFRKMWNCKCDCGQLVTVAGINLTKKRTKSCGCIAKESQKSTLDLIGKQFGKLKVIEFGSWIGKNKVRTWICECQCGKKIEVSRTHLRNNNTKSCGCLRFERINLVDLVNKRFGKLTVLKFTQRKNTKRYWLCICDCGKKIEVETSNLRNSKFCGHCQMYKNGRKVSYVQLSLFNLINRGVINFKSGPYVIDIALILNNKKIAIEYDSWKWHKNRIKQDKKRTEYLMKRGWSILSIKSNSKLPNIIDLNKALKQISQNNCNYYELFLDDWGDK